MLHALATRHSHMSTTMSSFSSLCLTGPSEHRERQFVRGALLQVSSEGAGAGAEAGGATEEDVR